jgi:hypothetical protein
MKTLKISEELHQDIKKYCADNSKNVQDIVEDKLSELVHKQFNIGAMQIIGTNTDTVTFSMEKDSVIVMTELFKKLVLNKPLDNIDIITDLIKSVKTLEDFIEVSNVQDKAKKADEKVVKEFFDSEKSHLSILHEEMVKTLSDKEKDEKKLENKLVDTINESDINNLINNNAEKNLSVITRETDLPSLEESTLESIAVSIGINPKEDVEKFEAMKKGYEKHVQVANGERERVYDVKLDNVYYDVKEYRMDTKLIILATSNVIEKGYQEKTVEAFSILKSLNVSSNNYNEIVSKIKPMFHILELPKHLKEFSENEGDSTDCMWIYNLDKDGEYVLSETTDTIEIISTEEVTDDMFVKPAVLGKYMKAIKSK